MEEDNRQALLNVSERLTRMRVNAEREIRGITLSGTVLLEKYLVKTAEQVGEVTNLGQSGGILSAVQAARLRGVADSLDEVSVTLSTERERKSRAITDVCNS